MKTHRSCEIVLQILHAESTLWECSDDIHLQTLDDPVQFQRSSVSWLVNWFLLKIVRLSKYYKRAARLVMRISRISSIFFHKVTFILIHIYHIVSRWSVLLAWSHLSFITSVISFAVDRTLTESKRHMRHKAPWEKCQISLSRWPLLSKNIDFHLWTWSKCPMIIVTVYWSLQIME